MNTKNKTPRKFKKIRLICNFKDIPYILCNIILSIALMGCFLKENSNAEIIEEPMVEDITIIIEPTVDTTIEITTETITETTTITEITIQTTTMTTETTTEKFIEEDYNYNIIKSYNTSVRSNLTEEQIEYILEGTYLEGTGWAFKEIEDTYGVNAVFALSVAETETTFGRYGVAQSHNNAFGLTSIYGGFEYFDSLEESILYFGAYIPRVHWNNGRYYIGDIAPIYCDYEWGDKVEGSLEYWYDVIESIY